MMDHACSEASIAAARPRQAAKFERRGSWPSAQLLSGPPYRLSRHAIRYKEDLRTLQGRPRYAHVGEEPVIKLEKFLVLASRSRACAIGASHATKFSGPSRPAKRGGASTYRLNWMQCCRKSCFTSVLERNNAWLRELIGRLSKARVISVSCPPQRLKR